MKRKRPRVVVRQVPRKGLTVELWVTFRYPWPPMQTILAEVRAATERVKDRFGDKG